MKVEISIKEAAQLIKEIEQKPVKILEMVKVCLLYTSDAADE